MNYLRELYVAAEAQLDGEGIDVFDFHDPVKSTRICLDLVGLLLIMQRNGKLEFASRTIEDELKKLRENEIEAIVEEIEAGMRDHADRIYDEMREEGV